MKTYNNKGIAILLVILMVLQCMPLTALAVSIESNAIWMSGLVEEDSFIEDQQTETMKPNGAQMYDLPEGPARDEPTEGGVFVTFVYYDANHNQVTDKRAVEQDGTVQAPTPPARDGCAFIKWDKNLTNVTESITTNAIYRITVRFMYYNGSATTESVQSTKYYESGKWYTTLTGSGTTSVSTMSVYHRVGHEFISWDTADYSTLTKPTDVHGVYEQRPTVSLLYYNGTSATESVAATWTWMNGGYYTTSAKVNAFPALSTLHRMGHEFTGNWLKEGGMPFDLSEAPDGMESMVVRAEYKPLPVLTFEYYSNATTVKTEQRNVYNGKLYNPTKANAEQAVPAVTKNQRLGYEFIGWNPADYLGMTESGMVTAVYTEQPTVSFMYYTSTSTAPSTFATWTWYDDGYYTTAASQPTVLPAPSVTHRTGNVFTGKWLKEDGEYFDLTVAPDGMESMMVYAEYTPMPLLTFEYYSSTSTTPTTTQRYLYNNALYSTTSASTSALPSTLTSASAPTHRVGYEFTGFEPADYLTLAEDTTVRAVYRPLPLLTFEYYSGTGTTPITTQRYLYNRTLYSATSASASTIASITKNLRVGYELMGWEPADYLDLAESGTVTAVYAERPTVSFMYYTSTATVEATHSIWTWYDDGYYSTSSAKPSVLPAPSVTHRTGHVFTGRWLKDDGEYFDMSVTPSNMESMVVRAEYTPMPLLTFEYYSGTGTTPIMTQRYLYNRTLYSTTSANASTLSSITKNLRVGYELMGWEPADYLDSAESGIVTAVYDERPTVTFMYYSSTATAETAYSTWTLYSDGYYTTSTSKPTVLPAPGVTHRTGHVFTGKWLKEDGGYFDMAVIPDNMESMVVRAEYTKMPLLTFEYYTGTNTAPTITQRYLYNRTLYSTTSAGTSSLPTITRNTRVGYEFLGWEPADYLDLAESGTVTALYTERPTVSFMYYSSTATAPSAYGIWTWYDDGYYTTSASKPTVLPAPSVTHRTGNVFTGKWLKGDGEYFDLTVAPDGMESMMVHAEYTKMPLLTFEYYTGTSITLTTTQRYLYNNLLYSTTSTSTSSLPTALTSASAPTHRVGYEFTGFEPADYLTLAEDTTVRAVYRPLPLLTFEYYAAADSAPTKAQRYLYNGTLYSTTGTATSAEPVNTAYHRTGYSFLGWLPADYKALGESATVVAQYSDPLPSVTFMYHSGTSGSQSVYTSWTLDDGRFYSTAGEQTVLPNPGLMHRFGYPFTGNWATKDGTLWNMDTDLQESITLYAQYEQRLPLLTFTYYLDTSETATKEQRYLYNGTLYSTTSASALSEPALSPYHRTGYHHLGWEPSDFKSLAQSQVVVAQYGQTLPTVRFAYYIGEMEDPSTYATWTLHDGDFYTSAGRQSVLPNPGLMHRFGYPFTGNWVTQDGTPWQIDPDLQESITLYAEYEQRLPLLTFTYYSGANTEPTVALRYLYNGTLYAATSASTSAEPSLSAYHRVGYAYLGWEPADFRSLTESATVTALYSPARPTVSFMYYSGAAETATEYARWTLMDGGFYTTSGMQSALPVLAATHRVGYSHTGKWLLDGEPWTPNTNLTEPIVLYAEYGEPMPVITYKYYSGANTSPSYVYWTMYPDGFYNGATKQTALPTLSETHRTGYKYLGWYQDGQAFQMPQPISESIEVEALYDIYVTFRYYLNTNTASTAQDVLVKMGEPVTPPSLSEDHRTGYTFVGWDQQASFESVTKTFTTQALYTPNEYSVTVLDYDGTPLLPTQSVLYEMVARLPNAARAGHTFTRWRVEPEDADPLLVTCDMTLTAEYDINTYKVTFVSAGRDAVYGEFALPYMGSIDQGGVEMGTILQQARQDAPQNYVFSHWSRSLDNVAGNMVVFPYYKPGTHAVTFVDYEDNVLGQDTVVYDGTANPPVSVDPNHRPGYTVSGWDRSLDHITEDTIIRATYSLNWIKVTYQYGEGDSAYKYKLELVPYEGDSTPPADPVRDGFTFTGWADEQGNPDDGKHIVAERVIYAQFAPVTYTVTFVDHEGTELGTRTALYRQTPDTTGIDVDREGFIFTGWEPSIERVKGDLVVAAQYRPYEVTVRFYTTVNAQQAHSALFDTQIAVPDASGTYFVTPDGAYTWQLNGNAFTGEIPEELVSEGRILDVYADQTHYTLQLIDMVSGASRTELVRAGGSYTLVPEQHDGYVFTGWSPSEGIDGDTVTVNGPMTLSATYEQADADTRWISYYDKPEGQGGQVIYRQSVLAGGMVTNWPNEAYTPASEGATFLRWDAALPFVNVQENMDVYPIFEAWPKATFYNWDNDVTPLYQVSLEKGTLASYQGALPTRSGYEFIGWYPNPALTPISADTEFVAQFRSPDESKYLLTIYYRFEDGREAAKPYTAILPFGESYRVASPANIQGFEPNRAYVSGEINEDAPIHIIEQVTYLSSTGTDYVVRHYHQKLGVPLTGGDDADLIKYDLVLQENLKAMTGSIITIEPRDFAGFTLLQDQNLTHQISADGGAVINVFYTRDTYALYFLSLGGSYVEPIIAEAGTDISALLKESKVSTRVGYTFLGWDQPIPDKMPAGGGTFTAIWEPDGLTPYTIVYWVQNVGGDGYDFYTSASRSGTVGTEITLGQDDLVEIDHFKFERSDGGKTIAGNGSTVVGVFYTRNEYTITFRKEASAALLGTITARYGENIVEKWKDTVGGFSTGNADYTSALWSALLSGNGPWLSIIEIMPGENPTYYGRLTSGMLYQDFHFLQPLDENNQPIRNYDEYDLYTTISVRYGSGLLSTFTEDFFPIDGYYRAWSNPGNWNEDTTPGSSISFDADQQIRFYYNLRQYNVTFINGDQRPESFQVYYTTPLSSIYIDPSTRPAGVGADWTFEGWHQTQDMSDPRFEFEGKKMPSNNLVFYAKWTPPTHDVKFYYTNEDDTEVLFAHQRVPQGDYAAMPSAPNLPGYMLSGWYERDSSVAFQFDTQQIVKDTELVARWIAREDIAYTVNYYQVDAHWQEGDAPLGLISAINPNPKQVLNNRMASTVYEEAPAVDGFAPDLVSKSITLNADGNTLNFYYKPYETLSYTVRYVDENEGQLLPAKLVSDESKAVVIELAPDIEGYSPRSAQQVLRLGTDNEANTITFVYTPNASAQYRVEHYYMSPVNGTYPQQPDFVQDTLSGPVGLKVTAPVRPLSGYELDQINSTIAGYIDGESVLVLRLYYRRSDVAWSVNYLRYGTQIPVAPSENGTMRLGYTKTAAEIALTGYTYTHSTPDPKQISITGDPSANVINFYYKKNVTVQLPPLELDYTGAPLQAPGVPSEQVNIQGGLYPDHALSGVTVTFAGNVVDVGTYGDAVVPAAIAITGGDLDQYNIVYVPSDLIVYGRVTYHSNYPSWHPASDDTYLDPARYMYGEALATVSIGQTGFDTSYLEFVGWATAEGGELPGAMPGASIDAYAQWRPVQYTLTVHHYQQGTTNSVVADETGTYRFGEAYNYTPKSVPGYTPIGTGVLGTMPGGNLELAIYYTRNGGFTLTVHHYEEGTTDRVADDQTSSWLAGEAYTFAPLSVPGFTAIGTGGSGIMPEGDLELTIYYTRDSYTLTVRHLLQGTTTRLTSDRTGTYLYDDAYSYAPQNIAGYTPVGNGGSGRMPANDLTVTVYYTRNNYTLTVRHYEDGTTNRVADDQVIRYAFGQTYTYAPLSVPGYTAIGTGGSGAMPANNLTVTVYYTPDGTVVDPGVVDPQPEVPTEPTPPRPQPQPAREDTSRLTGDSQFTIMDDDVPLGGIISQNVGLCAE